MAITLLVNGVPLTVGPGASIDLSPSAQVTILVDGTAIDPTNPSLAALGVAPPNLTITIGGETVTLAGFVDPTGDAGGGLVGPDGTIVMASTAQGLIQTATGPSPEGPLQPGAGGPTGPDGFDAGGSSQSVIDFLASLFNEFGFSPSGDFEPFPFPPFDVPVFDEFLLLLLDEEVAIAALAEALGEFLLFTDSPLLPDLSNPTAPNDFAFFNVPGAPLYNADGSLNTDFDNASGSSGLPIDSNVNYGLNGNDTVELADKGNPNGNNLKELFGVPTAFYGGTGDDTLAGGNDHDIIVGDGLEAGNSVLDCGDQGKGKDKETEKVVIKGDDDTLDGAVGNDVLLGDGLLSKPGVDLEPSDIGFPNLVTPPTGGPAIESDPASVFMPADLKLNFLLGMFGPAGLKNVLDVETEIQSRVKIAGGDDTLTAGDGKDLAIGDALIVAEGRDSSDDVRDIRFIEQEVENGVNGDHHLNGAPEIVVKGGQDTIEGEAGADKLIGDGIARVPSSLLGSPHGGHGHDEKDDGHLEHFARGLRETKARLVGGDDRLVGDDSSPATAKVGVFDNTDFVRSTANDDDESTAVQQSLAERLGHEVTTFTGISAEEFAVALIGKDVLVLPENNGSLLGYAGAFSGEALDVIRNFVRSGGKLVIHGQTEGKSAAFLNELFDYDLSESFTTGQDASRLTGNEEGSAFDGAPRVLADNGATSALANLPGNGTSIYENPEGESTVAVFEEGAGEVTYLGWDWFLAAPEPGDVDGGWIEVQDRAVRPSSDDLMIGDGILNIGAKPEGRDGLPDAKIAFFDNDSFVSEEADDLYSSLMDLGHKLTFFESIDAEAIASALKGKDALVIPELDVDLAAALGQEALDVIRAFVEGGGKLMVFGDSNPNSAPALINALLEGTNVRQEDAGVTSFRTPEARLGGFDKGPLSLPDLNSRGLIDLPEDGSATSLYETPSGVSTVAQFTRGHGSVTFFGEDWFGFAVGEGGREGDEAWIKVLDIAVSPEPAGVFGGHDEMVGGAGADKMAGDGLINVAIDKDSFLDNGSYPYQTFGFQNGDGGGVSSLVKGGDDVMHGDAEGDRGTEPVIIVADGHETETDAQADIMLGDAILNVSIADDHMAPPIPNPDFAETAGPGWDSGWSDHGRTILEGGDDSQFGGAGGDRMVGDGILSAEDTHLLSQGYSADDWSKHEIWFDEELLFGDLTRKHDHYGQNGASNGQDHHAELIGGNDLMVGGGGDDLMRGDGLWELAEPQQNGIVTTQGGQGNHHDHHDDHSKIKLQQAEQAYGGNDLMFGGTGNDTAWGEGGADLVVGDALATGITASLGGLLEQLDPEGVLDGLGLGDVLGGLGDLGGFLGDDFFDTDDEEDGAGSAGGGIGELFALLLGFEETTGFEGFLVGGDDVLSGGDVDRLGPDHGGHDQGGDSFLDLLGGLDDIVLGDALIGLTGSVVPLLELTVEDGEEGRVRIADILNELFGLNIDSATLDPDAALNQFIAEGGNDKIEGNTGGDILAGDVIVHVNIGVPEASNGPEPGLAALAPGEFTALMRGGDDVIWGEDRHDEKAFGDKKKVAGEGEWLEESWSGLPEAKPVTIEFEGEPPVGVFDTYDEAGFSFENVDKDEDDDIGIEETFDIFEGTLRVAGESSTSSHFELTRGESGRFPPFSLLSFQLVEFDLGSEASITFTGTDIDGDPIAGATFTIDSSNAFDLYLDGIVELPPAFRNVNKVVIESDLQDRDELFRFDNFVVREELSFDDVIFGDLIAGVDLAEELAREFARTFPEATGGVGSIETAADVSAQYQLEGGRDTLVGGRGQDVIHGDGLIFGTGVFDDDEEDGGLFSATGLGAPSFATADLLSPLPVNAVGGHDLIFGDQMKMPKKHYQANGSEPYGADNASDDLIGDGILAAGGVQRLTGGNDEIRAGAGNDEIVGDGIFADTIHGMTVIAGNDLVDGGKGNDLIYGDGVIDATKRTITFSSGTVQDGAIPNGGGDVLTNEIMVSGFVGSITDVNVFTEILHGASGELEITVISPEGTEVVLSNNRGGSVDDVFNGTIWDDDGEGEFVGSAGELGPMERDLRPEDSLSAFDEEDPNGVWTIRIEDEFGGINTGTLNGWSLTIETEGGDDFDLLDASTFGQDRIQFDGTMPGTGNSFQGGADDLQGGKGDDTVYGEGGDDRVDGGADIDIVFGGVGSDTGVWGDPTAMRRFVTGDGIALPNVGGGIATAKVGEKDYYDGNFGNFDGTTFEVNRTEGRDDPTEPLTLAYDESRAEDFDTLLLALSEAQLATPGVLSNLGVYQTWLANPGGDTREFEFSALPLVAVEWEDVDFAVYWCEDHVAQDIRFGSDGGDLLVGREARPSFGETLSDSELFNNMLLGRGGDDRLVGDGDGGEDIGNDILLGQSGNDTLLGDLDRSLIGRTGGDDKLIGGADEDILVGDTGLEDGADDLRGEIGEEGSGPAQGGHDKLFGDFFDPATADEPGNDGTDQLYGDARGDIVGEGGAHAARGGDDLLVGGGNNQTEDLVGDAGGHIYGGIGGNDRIYGDYQSGNPAGGVDRLYGDARFSLSAGAVGGNDLLVGGAGGDLALIGDAGSVIFNSQAGDDVLIGDFDVGRQDGHGHEAWYQSFDPSAGGGDTLYGDGNADLVPLARNDAGNITAGSDELIGDNRLTVGADDELWHGLPDLPNAGDDELIGDVFRNIGFQETSSAAVRGGDDKLVGDNAIDISLGESDGYHNYGQDPVRISELLDGGNDTIVGDAGGSLIGSVVPVLPGSGSGLDIALLNDGTYVTSTIFNTSVVDITASLNKFDHNVTQFSGLTQAEIAAALDGKDALVITGLVFPPGTPIEENGLGDFLSTIPGAIDEIRDFVTGGGKLIVTASPTSGVTEDLLGDLFGIPEFIEGLPFGFDESGSVAERRDDDVLGTSFQQGPADLPIGIDFTNHGVSQPDSTIQGPIIGRLATDGSATPLYSVMNPQGFETAVAATFDVDGTPDGDEQVIYLGWTWEVVAQSATGQVAWEEVLNLAVTMGGTLSGDGDSEPAPQSGVAYGGDDHLVGDTALKIDGGAEGAYEHWQGWSGGYGPVSLPMAGADIMAGDVLNNGSSNLADMHRAIGGKDVLYGDFHVELKNLGKLEHEIRYEIEALIDQLPSSPYGYGDPYHKPSLQGLLDHLLDNLGAGDTLYGDAGGDMTESIGGNDLIHGQGGGDTIFGDAGGAMLRSTGGDDIVFGGGGNDVISGDGERFSNTSSMRNIGGGDELYGGKGNDTIVGESFNFMAATDAGNDTIDGGYGDDVIFGETSNTSSGASVGGSDTLYGREGDDIMSGGSSTLAFGSSDGGDTIEGGAGNDLLAGDARDRIYEGSEAGNDRLDGGTGNDILHGDAAGRSSFLSSFRGDAFEFDSEGLIIVGGLGGDDTLDGGAGSDTVFGGGGSDIGIWRGADHDTADLDIYDGGGGTGGTVLSTDTMDYDAGTDARSDGGDDDMDTLHLILTSEQFDDSDVWQEIFELRNQIADADDDGEDDGDDDEVFAFRSLDGDDLITGDVDLRVIEWEEIRVSLQGCEDLMIDPTNFSRFDEGMANFFQGGSQADFFHGLGGDDVLIGDDGDDGFLGDDVLVGGDGSDLILGDDNNDLDGNNGGKGGDDKLFGGDGPDTIVGDTGAPLSSGSTELPFETLAFDDAVGVDLVNAALGGDDLINGGQNAGRDTSGDGVNHLYGDAYRDVKSSSVGGDDSIDGGQGVDMIYGDAGYDIIGDGGESTNGTTDPLFVPAYGEEIELYSRGGNDRIAGDEGNDTISGDAGRDIFGVFDRGEGGDDFIVGDQLRIEEGSFPDDGPIGVFMPGEGRDVIYGDAGGSIEGPMAAGGDDIIYGDGYWLALNGVQDGAIPASDGDDSIFGDAGGLIIDGAKGGKDLIFGQGGKDVVSGDAGSDIIAGGAEGGDDTISGGSGDDDLRGDSGAGLRDGAIGGDDIIAGDDLELYDEHGRPVITSIANGRAGEDVITGDARYTVERSSRAGNDLLVGDHLAIIGFLAGYGDSIYDRGHENGSGDGYGSNGIHYDIPSFKSAASDRIAGDAFGPESLGSEDWFFGIGGDDVIFGDNHIHFVDAQSYLDADDSEFGGDDFLWGDVGRESMSSTFGRMEAGAQGGNDLIFGQGGNDLVVGDANGDIIGGETRAGDDTLFGGYGRDSLFGDTESTLRGGAVAGNDTLFGGPGNDTLIGDAQNAITDATAGDDWLFGGTDDDILVGDTKALRFASKEARADFSILGNDDLWGEEGDDILIGDVGFVSLFEAMFVTAFGSPPEFPGPISAPLIGHTGGNDLLYGGKGYDALVGDNTGDIRDFLPSEGSSESQRDGSGGNDTLVGGKDSDRLVGDALGDIEVHGEGGDDLLFGDEGNDVLIGDAGRDVGDVARLRIADGPDTARGGNDVLIGGSGNDILIGDAGDELDEGGTGGDDLLEGGTGQDRLAGDAGNNLEGAFNANFGDGERGNESLIGRTRGGNDILKGGEGSDVLSGDAANTLQRGSDGGNDTLFGGDGRDFLYGDAGGEIFNGEPEEETPIGAIEAGSVGGNDTLLGGNGDDVLVGDSAEALLGTGGNDVLDGGAGNDDLWGDSPFVGEGAITGEDVFLAWALGNGDDTIHDFEVAKDVLRIVDVMAFGADSVAAAALDAAGVMVSDSGPGGDVKVTFGATGGSVDIKGIGTGAITSVELLDSAIDLEIQA